jgi:hypothetical protein
LEGRRFKKPPCGGPLLQAFTSAAEWALRYCARNPPVGFGDVYEWAGELAIREGSYPLLQKARYVPLSVQDPENLKRTASRLIDDEEGKNPVKEDIPAREIGAAVAAVRNLGQLVKTFEEFGDDPVSRFHALLFQEVKPDSVDIENGVLGKLKRVQSLPAYVFARCDSLNAASFRRASSGPQTWPAATCSRARSIL